MASYWKQNDVLKVIKDYDDCNDILEELLNLEIYNDDGKAEDASSNITNLNFICNAEEISKIIKNVAKYNDGKITFVTK